MEQKVNIVYVSLWNKPLGAISWDKNNDYGIFAYDDNFLQSGLDPAPLMMPVKEARKRDEPVFIFPDLPRKTFHGVPGMISDSLPDTFGNKIINEWLARLGRDPESFSEIERLCYMGSRGMGALEFKPVLDKNFEKSISVEVNDLLNLAQKVLDKKYNFTTSLHDKNALKNILRVGTSAGGSRPKAIIAYNDKNKKVRTGQVKAPKGYTYWILKFDGVKDNELGDPQGYTNIEYSYYKMAKECNIDMTECRLLNDGNRNHFMTKRFDRDDNGEKFHSQTLCAIAHYDYKDKFHHSYEETFQILRELKLPYHDKEQLFKRIVFNVISVNRDDHTKNISFLMNKNSLWRLSPAYDMTYAFNPSGDWTGKHQMSINNKRENINLKDLYTIAINNGIKNYKNIIEQTSDTISRWPFFAKESGVNKIHIKKIGDLHNLNLNSSNSFSISF